MSFSILLPLLLLGCSTVPQRDASRLAAAAQAYDAIKVDMTEMEAMEVLGPPTITDGRTISWFTRFNRSNYESLTISIDENSKIEETIRKHWRSSGGSFDYSRIESFSRSYYE